MNIFEILSAGNRVLKEEHISAVLGWLLDPSHDHGLGVEFLKSFASLTFPGSELDKHLRANESRGLTKRDQPKLIIQTQLEYEVVGKAKRSRSIDILVEIDKKHLLVIENKTSLGSIETLQLQDEALGLLGDERWAGRTLYFVFLTPKGSSQKSEQALSAIPDQVKHKVHAVWQGEKNSVSASLKALLSRETTGEVNPISTEVKFLLRSFVQFIDNGFTFFQGQAEQDGSYFQDVFEGIFGVKADERFEKGLGFVGYTGGVEILKNDLEAAQQDESLRARLLSRRPFKWAESRSQGGKTASNWIPMGEFAEVIRRSGY